MSIDISYKVYIETLKKEITQGRLKAHLAVNKELVLLYWRIGKQILQMQEKEGWWTKVIEQVSNDLRKEFPEMKGLSFRNLVYMRTFSDRWSDMEIMQQLAAQIPWLHTCALLDKVNEQEKRIWYTGKTLENGWSRNVLVHQIESDLYGHQGKDLTNFKKTGQTLKSDFAQELVKSPYNFEFLCRQSSGKIS